MKVKPGNLIFDKLIPLLLGMFIALIVHTFLGMEAQANANTSAPRLKLQREAAGPTIRLAGLLSQQKIKNIVEASNQCTDGMGDFVLLNGYYVYQPNNNSKKKSPPEQVKKMSECFMGVMYEHATKAKENASIAFKGTHPYIAALLDHYCTDRPYRQKWVRGIISRDQCYQIILGQIIMETSDVERNYHEEINKRYVIDFGKNQPQTTSVAAERIKKWHESEFKLRGLPELNGAPDKRKFIAENKLDFSAFQHNVRKVLGMALRFECGEEGSGKDKSPLKGLNMERCFNTNLSLLYVELRGVFAKMILAVQHELLWSGFDGNCTKAMPYRYAKCNASADWPLHLSFEEPITQIAENHYLQDNLRTLKGLDGERWPLPIDDQLADLERNKIAAEIKETAKVPAHLGSEAKDQNIGSEISAEIAAGDFGIEDPHASGGRSGESEYLFYENINCDEIAMQEIQTEQMSADEYAKNLADARAFACTIKTDQKMNLDPLMVLLADHVLRLTPMIRAPMGRQPSAMQGRSMVNAAIQKIDKILDHSETTVELKLFLSESKEYMDRLGAELTTKQSCLDMNTCEVEVGTLVLAIQNSVCKWKAFTEQAHPNRMSQFPSNINAVFCD